MATGRSIVQRALRMLAVIGQGQTLDAEQENDALESLNDLIASWSAEGMMIVATTQEAFTLTAGQIAYTIGTGGDLNTERPHQIVGGYITDGNDYPLTSLSRDSFNSIWSKGTSARPNQFYYRASYPLGNLYFDYTPASDYAVKLELMKPLTAIASLITTVSLPAEYVRALASNLAIDIAPEYEVQVNPAVVKMADESKATIKRLNFANNIQDAKFDPEISGRRDAFDMAGGNGGSFTTVTDDDGTVYPL